MSECAVLYWGWDSGLVDVPQTTNGRCCLALESADTQTRGMEKKREKPVVNWRRALRDTRQMPAITWQVVRGEWLAARGM